MAQTDNFKQVVVETTEDLTWHFEVIYMPRSRELKGVCKRS